MLHHPLRSVDPVLKHPFLDPDVEPDANQAYRVIPIPLMDWSSLLRRAAVPETSVTRGSQGLSPKPSRERDGARAVASAGQCLAEYGMAKGEAATSLCLLEVQGRVEASHDAALQATRWAASVSREFT